MIEYLSVEQVIGLHETAAGSAPLLDRDTLESAVLRPQAGFGGQAAHPTLPDKAAALLHGLSSTQCFEDGNKRTAWIATVVFLELNGRVVRDMPDIEAEAFVIAVATSAWTARTVEKAAEWLQAATSTARAGKDHRLEYAMLARAVEIDVGGASGTVSIVDGGLGVAVAEALPAHLRFAVALRIHWDEADLGSTHEVAATLFQPDGFPAQAGPARCSCVVGRGGHPEYHGGVLPGIVALTLTVVLVTAGTHQVSVTIDGKEVTRLPLRVHSG